MSSTPEHARAEEALRQSEERYRLLIESVKDYAIFMLDPAGNVVTWNTGAERTQGYRAEEIIGKHFSIFYLPEDIAAGKPAELLRLAATEGRCEDEGWRLCKDGRRFWANAVITALRDPAGQLQGFAKVTRDMTEKRRLDDQARQLEREQAARAAAEAASRRKDEFLAMLAHELRNPLAPLMTGLALLRRAGGDPQVLVRMLDIMERQVHHLKRLVEGLLDVARIKRGKIELQLRRLDLARLVRAAAEDRRTPLEQAGLVVGVAVPETPVWVRADETRLAQVLANLLDNAAKFTPAGGRIELRLAAEPTTQQAVLVVRDTGAGIAADLLPHIFESFTQADRSLERTQGGLGLGLAVVKGLVELHGGAVEAASAGPGHGAEFRIRLPLEAEPPALATAAVEPSPVERHLRIVVVEDNVDAARALQLLLQLQGHEVRVAATGPDGVQLAADWQPDAVISDIGLPGLDGYGVAAALRRNPATAQTRLIALTGYGADADRERGRRAGFDSYLVKPANPTQLEQALTAGA